MPSLSMCLFVSPPPRAPPPVPGLVYRTVLPGCVSSEWQAGVGEHPFVFIRDAAAFPILALP